MHYNTSKKNRLLISVNTVLLFLFTSTGVFAQALAADAGANTNICNGAGTTIGGAPTASFGTGPYTYSWNPSTGLSSASVANPLASPTTTTTYTVVVTDAVFSTASSSIIVNVNPIPDITAAPSSQTICSNGNPAISLSSSVGGTSFTWTVSQSGVTGAFASGGSVIMQPLTTTGAVPGTATYTVTPTGPSGCVGTPSTVVITVNPSPNMTTSTTSSICSGATESISLTSDIPATYIWSAVDNTNTTGESTVVQSTSTMNDMVINSTSLAQAVSYTVQPTSISGGCAGSFYPITVTVNPIPTATSAPSSQTICSGTTTSFSLSSTVSGTTYSWTSSGAGVTGHSAGGGSAINQTLTHAGTTAANVIYTITPSFAGCPGSTTTATATVNPLPIVTATPSFQLVCTGTPVSISWTSNIAGTTFSWTSSQTNTSGATPSGSASSIFDILNATAAVPGTASYFVTPTAAGCAGTAASPSVQVDPVPDVTITPVPPVCSAAAPFNLVSLTSGGTWTGPGITNSSLGTFDPGILSLGSYQITYTGPIPCSNTDTIIITITNPDLYGHVTSSGGALSSGVNKAVLFNHYSSFMTFDTAQAVTVNASGNYHFTSVPPGSYLIKVFADTTAYPLVIPSYYTNEYLWDSALVITQGCVTDTANITMVEGIAGGGPGLLTGMVSQGAGFIRIPGDPVPGIDVKLGRNPGGQLVTSTSTDAGGIYTFTNIPVNVAGEHYTIYVDIPGLGRDSVYDVTITASSTAYTSLDYIADSNSVYPIYPVATSVSNQLMAEDVKFKVYPNPSNTSTTVDYSLNKDAFVTLKIYDVLGKDLETPVNAGQQEGNYKMILPKLKAGIYFIRLSINNNITTTRLVVID